MNYYGLGFFIYTDERFRRYFKRPLKAHLFDRGILDADLKITDSLCLGADCIIYLLLSRPNDTVYGYGFTDRSLITQIHIAVYCLVM